MALVLAINGSPHIGNTDVLVEKAVAGCREAGAQAEEVRLRELSFSLVLRPGRSAQQLTSGLLCFIFIQIAIL